MYRRMESIVIQSDIVNMVLAENFVDAICDERHLDNYYATISVPVLKAVENAILFGSKNNSKSSVTLSCDYYRGGIVFTIQAPESCFAEIPNGDIPPAGSFQEAMFLVGMLADEVKPSDDGCSLQIKFAIQGIKPEEAAQRIAVLEKFYMPEVVEA